MANVSWILNALGALGVVVALATTAAFALGVYVLQSGGRSLAARLLAAYLMLQPFALGPVAIVLANHTGSAIPALAPMLLGLVIFCLLAALLVAFALSYPAVANPSLGWRSAVVGAFLPPIALIVYIAANIATEWDPGVAGHLAAVGRFTTTATIVFTFVASVAALIVFAWRQRRATTALEERRLRFMKKAVGIPLALSSAPFVTLFVLALVTGGTAIRAGLLAYAFLASLLLFGAAAVLVPAVGMGLGLLRYKVLDYDLGRRKVIRLTIRRGTIIGLFVAVFFAVSEGAQVLIANQARSNIVGVLGASLLVFFLAPLQNVADRWADRAAPREDPEKYRAFRRWEVYRAAFEEMSVDSQVTPAETKALDALARGLSLAERDRQLIEAEVHRERDGGT